VAARPSAKAQAWVYFDRIVSLAAPQGKHSNPWALGPDSQLRFQPDYATLVRLLGVPLHLNAGSQSGVPALALDVWLSYEFRRAGFDADRIWPRPTNPRILPTAVSALTNALPSRLGSQVKEFITHNTSINGATSSAAAILGKNYEKQVDVIMTDWATGPELLVSTKRMDSSYGKNAPNRIEESYGDAKNLRLRYPLAALGFAFAIRADVFEKEPRAAEWLIDLLIKLGREDDAYDATCLILMDYPDSAALAEGAQEAPVERMVEPGPSQDDEELVTLAPSTVDQVIAALPKVTLREERTPPQLAPSCFLGALVTQILDTTPVNMHREARERRRGAASLPSP
jgi:hypothetical protein